MIEILKTALPLAEIAIIKRDFDLLRKLLPSLTSDKKEKALSCICTQLRAFIIWIFTVAYQRTITPLLHNHLRYRIIAVIATVIKLLSKAM